MDTIKQEINVTERNENQEKELLTSRNSSEIMREVSLTFEENFIAESGSDCDPYGCTCISYEKCCGCFIQ